MTEERAHPDDLRAEYRAICDYEIAVTQMRFQTLSIFIAAVGLIIGLTHPTRALGVLLIALTAGLWIIDLRNRDMLARFREMGSRREASMLGDEARLFRDREGPHETATLGLLNRQTQVSGRWARLIAFQVGIDVIFFGVVGYAISLLAETHGWRAVLVTLVPAGALIAVLSMMDFRRRRRPRDEAMTSG